MQEPAPKVQGTEMHLKHLPDKMPNRPRGVAGNPSKVQTLKVNFLLLLSDPIRIVISCIKGCSKVATA